MKKWIIPIVIILLMGVGYVAYNMIQQNKDNQQDLAALQIQIEELNTQLSGMQETGIVDEDIIQAPEVVEANNIPDISQNTNTVSIGATNTTIQPTPTSPVTNEITVSPNKLSSYNICERYGNPDGLPNKNRGSAAKLINSRLQYLWDNGQHLLKNEIDDANLKLNDPSLNVLDKCAYSRLIDELLNQKGYIRSYSTENGITTIGIDFISFQDDISKIFIDGISPAIYKNTSTKVRYYTLSSNSELEKLSIDSNGVVVTDFYGLVKTQLNNFNLWVNQFCNNEPIYNGEDTYNFNEFNGFCLKNRIIDEQFNFRFEDGKIKAIKMRDRRWHIYMAG